MQCVTIQVGGEPKGQPRPKARVVKGRAFIYTPHTAEDWKNAIRTELKVQNIQPTDDIWDLEVIFFMPRPKSHFGTGKNSKKLKDYAPTLHEAKPDLDNLLKAVMDALTSTDKHPYGFWKDDSKVVTLRSSKIYNWREMPGAIVTVTKINRETGGFNYETNKPKEGPRPDDHDGEEVLPPRSATRGPRHKGYGVEPIKTAQVHRTSQGPRRRRLVL